MLTNNFGFYGIKIFSELGRDIIYFPIWWYSRGLMLFAEKLWRFLSNREKAMALFVWVKNLFRPMYGQSDWQGVMISFFMRLVMIIFKGIVMAFWLIISLSLFIIWLILPVYAFYQIIFQING